MGEMITKRLYDEIEKAGFFGQRSEDALTRFIYWLHPPLKKERDLLLNKLQDYRQRIEEAESLASRLVLENQRLEAQVKAYIRPEQPRIFKAATAADVRRMTEKVFAEDKDGI